jgi:disulfide bond formation protein DsbB
MKKLIALFVCALMLVMSVVAIKLKCDGFHVWKYTFPDGTVSYSGKFARFIPWWIFVDDKIGSCVEDPTYPDWKM